ncbi:hypothetical protein EIN_327300 [Entamoeba invadens IP1]|uniref:Mitochondrial import receptor subunit TOM40 n=2 Tax=Entamoeba invadens TaxID=33085 RepID=A0A0A1U0K1_ENTIV|nr:hypothetical protein EIN_327300 [Entamoeba invadens IP1]ELP86083.1 hypothetical protein EIN_327300 [Entamoeba invadens IP1]BAN41113.1 hypothetical protein [Entamoeba invadens]|eukprot:XP_004185429.1 hypothetical protein EIN_327300 [Entamoeba invadens IP1]
MEALFDPHYTCEPYEAVGALTDSLQPDCFSGMKVEYTTQHSENLVTGHYLTIDPPAPKQKVNRIHSILYAGTWGNLIARIDNELHGSVLSTVNTPNKQINASLRAARNEDGNQAGLDIKATGFGRCVGFRYEKGGMYVTNLMQKINEKFSIGAECCLVPHKRLRTQSYGALCMINPQLISSFIYSELNTTFLSSVKYSPSQSVTFGGQFVFQQKPNKSMFGALFFEKVTQMALLKTSMNTTGTFSSSFQTSIKEIAGNLLLCVQANPFIGSYTYGLSLQLFR